MKIPTLFIFILCITIYSCRSHQEAEIMGNPILGDIQIDIHGTEKAIQSYKEGLLLLHSFEYKDAAEMFKKARVEDPNCAMAYWGGAMCENHPLWREQNYEKARNILQELGHTEEESRSKFKSEFEKDMYDAIAILYGEGSKQQRDKAYRDHMKLLYEKHPGNNEVAAFYALSLLGAQEDKRDLESYEQGARIAKSIIAENPNHPGALHYLIHSYDDPNNAPKAKAAADRYAQVAPDASHALHMPSHIYVALGMWDEVISSNEASWKASVTRKEAKALDNNSLGYHSYKWLMYGHLQKGHFDKAREILAHTQELCYEHPTSKSEGHLAMMKSAYLIESQRWDDPLVFDTVNYVERPVQIFGLHSMIRGMKAYAQQDDSKLAGIISELSAMIEQTSKEVYFGNPSMCSGSFGRDRPTQAHVDRAKVMKIELEILLDLLTGRNNLVEEKFLEATSLEETTMYMYGPPEVPKPSWEMYADWLLGQKRFDEAMAYYDKTLVRYPNRLWSVNGQKKVKNNS